MKPWPEICDEKKTKFDKFGILQKILDDRRHAHGSTSSGEVIVNMAVAISARAYMRNVKYHI